METGEQNDDKSHSRLYHDQRHVKVAEEKVIDEQVATLENIECMDGLGSSTVSSAASKTGRLSHSRQLTVPRDSRTDILSESEDEAPPHDDPFLFRAMGRKLREKLYKLGMSVFSKPHHDESSTLDRAPPTSTTIITTTNTTTTTASRANTITSTATAPMVTVTHQGNDLEIAIRSAVSIPFQQVGEQRDNYATVPIILSLLRVTFEDEEANLEKKKHAINAIFRITLQYGLECTWTIHRRLYDLFRLHILLTFKNVQSNMNWTLPKFPNQFVYIFDTAALKSMSRTERREHRKNLVMERKDALEKYFSDLLVSLNMQPNTLELFEFLEISRLSVRLLSHELGIKPKEGYLKNRLFETKQKSRWYSCLLCYIPDRRQYRTKWFIIRSSYIAFVDSITQSLPSDVLLCDKEFHIIVENEHHSKGQLQFLHPITITIVNGSKKLEVRPEQNSQINYWLEDLRRLAIDCIWCQSHRFGSFAPVRRDGKLEWLIDAEEYYREVIKSIDEAKEEIFIHGWWVSPELHLLRPAINHPEARLDRILQRKAREGVKIYIIVFKEFSMALYLNSYHTKVSMESLHPNIRVQRHPDHFSGTLYWAHHEKLVVIDQRIAFTGGLDLCFGRFDTQSHPLTDVTATQLWTGLDYANPRIKDFRNVIQYTTAMVDRQAVPRMPWHDVHCKVWGPSARDLGRHFIERWNFVKAKKAMHKEEHIPFLLPKPDYQEGRIPPDERGGLTIQAVRSISEWSIGTQPEHSIYNAYLHYIENAQHFIYIENQFFVSRSAERQNTPIQNRIAQAITERILRAANEKSSFKVIVLLPLLPAFEAPLHRSEASSLRMIMQGQYSGISRGPTSLLGQLAKYGIKAEDYITFFSLRKYSFLEGKAITEQLYVHTKVMIVDDQVALLGSANINDRSMLGVRDSEINLIVEGGDMIEGTLNDQPVSVSKKVRELRMRLFQEHLGLLELPFTDPRIEILADPTSQECYYGTLRKHAALNTQLFRELFHCLPDDCVDTWEEYKRFTEIPRVHVVDEELGINSLEMLNSIQGSLVMFPTQFLRKEDLSASLLTFESLLPVEIYI